MAPMQEGQRPKIDLAEFSAVDLLTLTGMRTLPDFTGRLTTGTMGSVAETRLQCDGGKGYLVERTDAVGMTNEGPKVRGLIGSHNEEVNRALKRAFESSDELAQHMRWNTLGTIARLRSIVEQRTAAWNDHSAMYQARHYECNPLVTLQEYIARTHSVPVKFNFLPGVTEPDEIMQRLFSSDSGFEFKGENPVKEEYPSQNRNYFYTVSGLVIPR